MSSTHVAVLATNERTRDALGGIHSTLIRGTQLHDLGKRHREFQLIIARLADLDRAQGRKELEDLIQALKPHVPVVLMSGKSERPKSDAAFQALAHLTWLVGREVYIAPDAAAVSRMVFARQAKAESSLIASATVEEGKLIAWSCEPRRYEIAAAEIPALARLSSAGLMKFQVSDSGSRIHWDEGDVDLNLDGIRACADPELRRQRETEYRKYAVRYAAAIRKLREERGLKQRDIEGLSERQVRRLEEGDTMPHSSTLRKLAVAHGMTVNDYMAALAKRSGSRGSGPRKTRKAPRRAAKKR